MADSIDLMRGVSLSTGYMLAGGVIGAVVDAVVSSFTQTKSPQELYEHRELRGVLQFIFSIASFGSLIELLGPANVDSPFALTCGAIMLFLSQPRMIMDLLHMFKKIERAIYVPKPVDYSPLAPAATSPINPFGPAGVAGSGQPASAGVPVTTPGLSHPQLIPPNAKPAAVPVLNTSRVPFQI